MTITVESAIDLDAATKKQIETVIAKHLKGNAITYTVNPSILGGLRVYLGSKRIDVSLKGRLSAIEKLA